METFVADIVVNNQPVRVEYRMIEIDFAHDRLWAGATHKVCIWDTDSEEFWDTDGQDLVRALKDHILKESLHDYHEFDDGASLL